ncbi:MAG: hypothetical protein ACE5G8_04075 [Anaerolineae bacterium]
MRRLGYPITEAIDHEGWRVQYFQRGRLEVHPENHPDYFITVGWLGQLSHRTQPPLPAPPNSTARFFPKTGHTVNGDFLTFFLDNGGTVQFGQPISEPFIHNGLLNQDFQSARFIWQPSLPAPARVQLEPLGETHFLSGDLPLSLLEPVSPPPGVDVYAPDTAPLPANWRAHLRLEATPRTGVVRVVATLSAGGRPVVNYAPHLLWGDGERALPATEPGGQTHTLVHLARQANTKFVLRDGPAGAVLASVEYAPPGAP